MRVRSFRAFTGQRVIVIGSSRFYLVAALASGYEEEMFRGPVILTDETTSHNALLYRLRTCRVLQIVFATFID